MMIVAFEDHEQPAHIQTDKHARIPKESVEAQLAVKLFEVMKLGRSFEECIRVVREQQGDETKSIAHLIEKYME